MKLKNKYISKKQSTRLYQVPTPIIGLTGGIATGKSTAAEIFKNKGFSIIGADLLVKEAYGLEEVKHEVRKLCPAAYTTNKIDFKILREKVFSNSDLKKSIENLIYSKLPTLFLEQVQNIEAEVIIYDVPLLFEKKLNELTDLSICVYVPREIQETRIKKRDGSSDQVIANILASQMDIEEKKKVADFVILNTETKLVLEQKIEKFILEYFE